MINEFFNKETEDVVGSEKKPDTYLYKLKENGLIIHRVFIDTVRLYRLITENADIIKGIFCGHWHNEAYTEIVASYEKNGVKIKKTIPQYVTDAVSYDKGHMMIITVR